MKIRPSYFALVCAAGLAMSTPACDQGAADPPTDGPPTATTSDTATVALALTAPEEGDFARLSIEDDVGRSLFSERIDGTSFNANLAFPVGTIRWNASLYESDGTPLAETSGELELERDIVNQLDIVLVIADAADVTDVGIDVSVEHAPTLVRGLVTIEEGAITAHTYFVDPDAGPVRTVMSGPATMLTDVGEQGDYDVVRFTPTEPLPGAFLINAVAYDFPNYVATLETFVVSYLDDELTALLALPEEVNPAWADCRESCFFDYDLCVFEAADTDDEVSVAACAEGLAECAQCPELVGEEILFTPYAKDSYTTNRCPEELVAPLVPLTEGGQPVFVVPDLTTAMFPNFDLEELGFGTQDPIGGTIYDAPATFVLDVAVFGPAADLASAPVLDECQTVVRLTDVTRPRVTVTIDPLDGQIGTVPVVTIEATDDFTAKEDLEIVKYVNGDVCPEDEPLFPGPYCVSVEVTDEAGNRTLSDEECVTVEMFVPAAVVTDTIDDYACVETGDGVELSAAVEVTPVGIGGDAPFEANKMFQHARLEAFDVDGEPLHSEVIGSVEDTELAGSGGAVVGSYARGDRTRFRFVVQPGVLSECPATLRVTGFALSNSCVVDWKGESDLAGDGLTPGCDAECGEPVALLGEAHMPADATRPLPGTNQQSLASLGVCGALLLSSWSPPTGSAVWERMLREAYEAYKKALEEASCFDKCKLVVGKPSFDPEQPDEDEDEKLKVCIRQRGLAAGSLGLFGETFLADGSRATASKYAKSHGGMPVAHAEARNECVLRGTIHEAAITEMTDRAYRADIICPARPPANSCESCCPAAGGWTLQCQHDTQFRAKVEVSNAGNAAAGAHLSVVGDCGPVKNENGVAVVKKDGKTVAAGAHFVGGYETDDNGALKPVADAKVNISVKWHYQQSNIETAGTTFSAPIEDDHWVGASNDLTCSTTFTLRGGVVRAQAAADKTWWNANTANASITHARARLRARAICGGQTSAALGWGQSISLKGE